MDFEFAVVKSVHRGGSKMAHMQLTVILCSILTLLATSAYDLDNEIVLIPEKDYIFRWSVDDNFIEIETVARTLGWLAFGFSPNGGMDQSDVMFGFVESGTGNISVSLLENSRMED